MRQLLSSSRLAAAIARSESPSHPPSLTSTSYLRLGAEPLVSVLINLPFSILYYALCLNSRHRPKIVSSAPISHIPFDRFCE